MGKPETFPDMETAYTKFQPLFYHALASLARQGFVAQPDDALDLIHEFFADAWAGLSAHYNPASGLVAPYIYSAFTQFARRYVMRGFRARQRFSDLAELADQVASRSAPPLEFLVQKEQVDALDQALQRLPSLQRRVLLDFFASGSGSRRMLAARYEFTRYRCDEVLLAAFGGLILRMGEHDIWPPADQELAFALWYEGRTPKEAAARLCTLVPQVHETRQRLVKRLAGLLASRATRAGSHVGSELR